METSSKGWLSKHELKEEEAMKYVLSLLVLLSASSVQAAAIFSYYGNTASGGGNYTASTAPGASTVAGMEVFLNLAGGSLDALSPDGNGASEGSAIKVNVDVAAGDTVSFDWLFETNEMVDGLCPSPDNICRDYAFYSATLTTADGLFLLADALLDRPSGNGSVSLTASGAGVLELGIGVLDSPRTDTLVTSTITASNFSFPSTNPPGGGIPSPMTLSLFGLGLLSMGLSRRRKAA